MAYGRNRSKTCGVTFGGFSASSRSFSALTRKRRKPSIWSNTREQERPDNLEDESGNDIALAETSSALPF